MIERWVAFWDRRESPLALVATRIALGLVVLFDLGVIGVYGLPPVLWGLVDGLSTVAPSTPWIYQVLPPSGAGPWILYGALVLTAGAFTAGFATRWAGLAFVVLYAQSDVINPLADRGIDRLIRIAILILSFSACSAMASVDARLRTGRWRGDDQPAPAWPRYLLLGQLVLTYFCAGLGKGGTEWLPVGRWSALYVVLQDPIFAVIDFSWLRRPIPFFFSQVSTAGTHLWELSAPLVLLAAWFRATPERDGRLRRLFTRVRARDLYVMVGVVFHLGLALTMRLGVFPFAMLSMFWVFFRPEEVAAGVARVRGRLVR